MENKQEQLRFTPDFRQACELFGLDPMYALQQFIDNVSLPKYFAFPLRPDRWANVFMLECVLASIEGVDVLERYDKFLSRMTEAIIQEKNDKEAVCRQIMDEWHKAVLEDRIKEVMEEKDQSNDK